jgi:hypothetical protein
MSASSEVKLASGRKYPEREGGGGREGGREGWRAGGRDGGREGGREGGESE